ncbi:MAG: hypothetical protein B6245_13285 [Desulfobacteraceae bacterium 4572_88]|nr:MAG: hypothetical protein B6245_13285 [Desulfobacteraceae bacterium 4572_88]
MAIPDEQREGFGSPPKHPPAPPSRGDFPVPLPADWQIRRRFVKTLPKTPPCAPLKGGFSCAAPGGLANPAELSGIWQSRTCRVSPGRAAGRDRAAPEKFFEKI